jgi:hypothetical protein
MLCQLYLEPKSIWLQGKEEIGSSPEQWPTNKFPLKIFGAFKNRKN